MDKTFKKYFFQIFFASALIFLSTLLYMIHFIIFKDSHHIFIYLLGDIAFVPVEVLLVTIVLHNILVMREKKNILRKLNMVIGSFFSEVGTRLIFVFNESDKSEISPAEKMLDIAKWKKSDFEQKQKYFARLKLSSAIKGEKLDELKAYLSRRREFLLHLLGNPNLLEHETFTDMIWAVFHLTEELCHRKTVATLTDSDYEHLNGDISRAYNRLTVEWIKYMKHLKYDYPYLFSLAARINPYDKNAKAEVVY